MAASSSQDQTSIAAAQRPPGRWVGLVAIVLSCTATAGEMILLAAGFLALAPVSLLLMAHLALVLVLVLGAVALWQGGGRSPLFILFVVATVTMGPLGSLGSALCAMLHRPLSRRATPFEAWYASLFPQSQVSRTTDLYKRIALRGGGPEISSSAASFADVMALGTVRQKQAVLTIIGDDFRQSFAPALLSALNDAEPAIRVQAATAMARIEGRILERGMALEERHLANPTAADTMLALAQHHDNYANNGIIDAARAQAERRQALEFYERVAELSPDTPGVGLATGRLLLRLGYPEQALKYLEAAAAVDASACPEALVWYLECLFRLRHTARLRHNARQHAELLASARLPDEIREAARLWSEAPARKR
jgi:tetratricopeptide (TPR) repeat protein